MTANTSRLDRAFRIGITIKGLDGLLEVLGSITLVFLPLAKVQGIVATLALREIAEDRHAFIANFILQLDHRINPHAQLFAVLYLLGHGTVKALLAVALLRGHYRLYPYAMAFLLAFIFYQSYRVGLDHSVLLGGLTLFDLAITWLVYQEWRLHTGRRTLK
jgi:uncharacterized membrane protein